MKCKPCSKCHKRPDILQAGNLKVAKCFGCGKCATTIGSKRELIQLWNELNH